MRDILTKEQHEALVNWLRGREYDIVLGMEDLGDLRPLLSLLENEKRHCLTCWCKDDEECWDIACNCEECYPGGCR